jgi:DNA repair protein RecO (recombination protein O)
MIVKTEGIVLRNYDYRETSKIASFYTWDHGKMRGVLKGIRKDPRKFGSYVDKFSVNDIVYYQYRKTDLHLISQCDLKQFFFPVRQDYKRNLAANYITELVDAVMPVEQPNQPVYTLMLQALNALETIQDISKLVYIFQIKILALSGFSPHIDACVKCNRPISGKVRFSLRSGGLICPSCPTQEQSFTLISRGTIATMLYVERNKWEKSLKLGMTKTVKKELKYILNHFLVYHLEKRIKSAKYL